MEPVLVAIACLMIAGLSLTADADEPKRTSWSLRDRTGTERLAVQIDTKYGTRGRVQLLFDTKFCTTALTPGTDVAIHVYRNEGEIASERAPHRNLRMAARVLYWRNVDAFLLPDTLDYHAEIAVGEHRFLLPNSMAAYFLVRVDPRWGVDRIEPPIVIEDTLGGDPQPLWPPQRGDFNQPLRPRQRVIPIPPRDDSVRAIPIPLWDGKRTVIPLVQKPLRFPGSMHDR